MKIPVIAQSYRHYRMWIARHMLNIHKFPYVSDYQHLRGYSVGHPLIGIEGWSENYNSKSVEFWNALERFSIKTMGWEEAPNENLGIRP